MNQIRLKGFHMLLVIPIRFRKLISQFCICSGKNGLSGLCKQSFSHGTFTEVSRSPTSLCESRISENWVAAIMWFCYILFQIRYIQHNFYKEINFLFVIWYLVQNSFSLWKNSSFSWQKNKNYSEMWKWHGFTPRRGNVKQKY